MVIASVVRPQCWVHLGGLITCTPCSGLSGSFSYFHQALLCCRQYPVQVAGRSLILPGATLVPSSHMDHFRAALQVINSLLQLPELASTLLFCIHSLQHDLMDLTSQFQVLRVHQAQSFASSPHCTAHRQSCQQGSSSLLLPASSSMDWALVTSSSQILYQSLELSFSHI